MTDKSVTFSPREMEVLALAWQCMETQPKIDMDKLAALTGYTPGSASVTLGKIKQKIKMVGSGAPAAPLTPKKAGGPGRSKTASSTKRGAAKASNDEDESPSKKCKAPAKKAREQELNVDDDEEEFVSAGVKKEQSPDGFGGFSFYDQAREAAGVDFEEET